MGAGRPTTYKDDIPQKLIKYFTDRPLRRVIQKKFINKKGELVEWEEEVANDFPTLAGFFWEHDIAKSSFHEWLDSKLYPELSDAYSKVKQYQENFLLTHGLLGSYNAAYAKFITTNLTEYRDKTETDHKSSDGSMSFNFVKKEK